MKMKKHFVSTVVTIMTVLLITEVQSDSVTTTRWTPTETPEQDLSWKMFTLSASNGGVYLYSPPFHPPSPSPSPYSTVLPQTTNQPTSYPPWTTRPPTRGVSVCLRYMTDNTGLSIFTLSPSTTPLGLDLSYEGFYVLKPYGYYNTLSLTPNLSFWPIQELNIWTSICITVDSMKNVAQMFRGSRMSIRKVLPYEYVWSGEPVIDFSGFDGQLTDVQVWDRPLRYKEVYNYMSRRSYGPYRGSILTWSSIRYRLDQKTLLEDIYELQAQQTIRGGRRGGRGGRMTGQKMSSRGFKVEESKETKKQRGLAKVEQTKK